MDHRKFLKQQGAKGGAAGTGKAKVRGDSAFYSRIAKLKKLDRKGTRVEASTK